MRTDKIKNDKPIDDVSISWFGPFVKEHLSKNKIQIKDFIAKLETSDYRYIGSTARIYRILEARTNPTYAEMLVIVETAKIDHDQFFRRLGEYTLRMARQGQLKNFKPVTDDENNDCE